MTSEVSQYNPGPINIRCPACRLKGAFHGVNAQDAGWNRIVNNRIASTVRVGIRQCPNIECRSVVFYAKDNDGRQIYPPEVIDFDSSNLPPRILASLEEAIKCHASGCYRASALMVRRVLEELCEDKQAGGDNLMKRLASLGKTVIIPQELLAAADDLRLLGNDAAHIEAKTYDQIGPDECAIAIELAKELLKAVYQYTDLVARLKAFKKPSA
ncbi:DUF4145 domain-containing protein [Ensifer sp. ENS02]|nr:DUF4145 domain-containing protein [Ensifer sp. ENS02]